MKLIASLLLSLTACQLWAQSADTLKIMAYNLLNYRNTTNQCTAATNDPVAKETNLRTLFFYYKPDVFICNEIGANPQSNYALLLDNVLNANGATSYRAANFSNNSFSSLVNMLYYNSDKVGLLRQDAITRDLANQQLVRVIDVYHLYYKDPNLAATQDTVFFTVIAAHLKAGTTAADASERARATAALMDYLQKNVVSGNVIMGGDLNVYNSSDAAYQNLVGFSNTAYRLYDPIDQPGSWSGSSTYRFYHTQSTRSSTTNGGCFSGGGLDDRLDHLLVQFPLLAPANRMRYLENSYRALGNDGNDFNQELDVNNNSLPTAIAQALYNISDHLPVKMEVEIDRITVGRPASPSVAVYHPTLVTHHLPVQWNTALPADCSINLYSVTGYLVAKQAATAGFADVAVHQLPAGLYIVTMESRQGIHYRARVLKQ